MFISASKLPLPTKRCWFLPVHVCPHILSQEWKQAERWIPPAAGHTHSHITSVQIENINSSCKIIGFKDSTIFKAIKSNNFHDNTTSIQCFH